MMKKTLLALSVALAASAGAKNLISNGDLEYGDGGWYLWNDPSGPAEATSKIGEPKIGFNGSNGAVVSIKKGPKEWWGLQIQPPKFLADTGFYELSFKARAEKGGVVVAIVQGGMPDYRQKASSSFTLSPEWKTYKMKFYADEKGYGVNNVTFQLGFVKGNVFFDDVEVTPGTGFDGKWYASAEARIDSIRKKDLVASGFNPGDTVQATLERHAFPFGTAIAIYGDPKDSVEQWYRKTADKYFWAAVPENIFKWPEYEPKKGQVRRAEMQKYLDFAKDLGWSFRGHVLVWGIQRYNYDKHWSIQGSCKDISKNIKKRIERDLKEYKGKISEYDVWNEPTHETFLFDKCGWELLDSAFVWAHRADPSARLYINDFNVVALGETERYYELIRGMLDRKIPVSGIGVQCHFGGASVIPELIHERLDRLAEFGLPIKVTEFDIGEYIEEKDGARGLPSRLTEEERADQYEVFIRSVYSHPAIVGIMFWGFWDARHWLPGGGIIAKDGSEKPRAKRIYDLWHKVWTTDVKVVADKDGKVHFRGFPGTYRLKARNGAEKVLPLE